MSFIKQSIVYVIIKEDGTATYRELVLIEIVLGYATTGAVREGKAI